MKGGHFHAQGGQEDKISERRTCPPVLPVSGNPNPKSKKKKREKDDSDDENDSNEFRFFKVIIARLLWK